jgi:hypothetical protein
LTGTEPVQVQWVFVRIYAGQPAANARRFLRDLERTAPMKITRVLTDNGKAFTDRLFGLRKRSLTGQHEFDQPCAELGIEHRLTPPMRPQTNPRHDPRTDGGSCLDVEGFNGRIEDVLQSHRFQSGEDLEKTLRRYVQLNNSQLPRPSSRGDPLSTHPRTSNVEGPNCSGSGYTITRDVTHRRISASIEISPLHAYSAASRKIIYTIKVQSRCPCVWVILKVPKDKMRRQDRL